MQSFIEQYDALEDSDKKKFIRRMLVASFSEHLTIPKKYRAEFPTNNPALNAGQNKKQRDEFIENGENYEMLEHLETVLKKQGIESLKEFFEYYLTEEVELSRIDLDEDDEEISKEERRERIEYDLQKAVALYIEAMNMFPELQLKKPHEFSNDMTKAEFAFERRLYERRLH